MAKGFPKMITQAVAKPTVKTLSPKPAPSAASKIQKQIDALNKQYKDKKIYNSDSNANLREAVISGNEGNTKAINDFNRMATNHTNGINNRANSLTNDFNRQTADLTNATNRGIHEAGQAQNKLTKNITDKYNLQSRKLTDATNRRMDGAVRNANSRTNSLTSGLNKRTSALTNNTNRGLHNAANSANRRAGALTNRLDKQSSNLTNSTNKQMGNAFNGYNSRSRALANAMGTTDKNTHARFKGQLYAGVDQGFDEASDDLQSSLAARGMSGSGIFAKSLKDLGRDKARAMSSAGVSAYSDAIDNSDSRRMAQLQNEGNLYGANTNNIQSRHNTSNSHIQQSFSNQMGTNQANYGRNTDSLMNRYSLSNNNNTQAFNNNMSANKDNFGRSTENTMNRYALTGDQQKQAYGTNMGVAADTHQRNTNNMMNEYSLTGKQYAQAYGNQTANANDAYQRNMGIQGQNLQNTLNNNQQKIGNLTGYAQLGRGMAGMSQNYLGQAGSGYGQIAATAGNTAMGIAGANNSYNATMQNAQAQQSAGKGSATGSLIGAGATMFSDSRLKKNVKKIGEVNGFNIVEWDWNEKGLEVASGMPTTGVIAQDAMRVDPSAVTMNKNGYLQVDYNKVFNGVYHG